MTWVSWRWQQQGRRARILTRDRDSVARLVVPGGDVACGSHLSSSFRTYLIDLTYLLNPDMGTGSLIKMGTPIILLDSTVNLLKV